MSAWWDDVETYEGAKGATRKGMFGALGFAAMLGIGAIVVSVMGGLPGQPQTAGYERIFALAGIAVEAAVTLLAAWRFRIGKGWVAGSIALLLFVIEIGMKLANGFLGIAWYVAYLAIFLALVNGVRGAWALRDMAEQPADLSDTFA